MACMEVFTQEEDELLVTLVSQHPLLYDLSLDDYENTRKKDNVWAEIAIQLNKRRDSCKKHWRNLKDTYYRQKRKHKGTGSAATKNPRSKIESYSKIFSFLDTVRSERPTISNINTSENSQISPQSEPSYMQTEPGDDLAKINNIDESSSTAPSPASQDARPPVNFPKSNRKRTRKDDILTYLQKREVSRQKLLEDQYKKNENDDLASFSEHIKIVLKNLTPILQLKAKKEIFEVLLKYQFLDVESETDSDHPKTSTSHISSISLADCTTPEHQNEPDIASTQNQNQYALVAASTQNQNQYALVAITNDNLPMPIYSPKSTVTMEEQEPTDLSRNYYQF